MSARRRRLQECIITSWVRVNRGLFSTCSDDGVKKPPDPPLSPASNIRGSPSDVGLGLKAGPQDDDDDVVPPGKPELKCSQPVPILGSAQATLASSVARHLPHVSAPGSSKSGGDDAKEDKNEREEKVLGEGEGWRLVEMTPDHVDKVIEIQQKCYEPEYREARQSYLDRIRIWPAGNVVLLAEEVHAKAASPRDGQSGSASPPEGASPSTSPTELSRMRGKKRKVGRFTMAGYILVQPYFREAANDVNDTKMLEKWLHECNAHPRGERDCIYTHEIAIDPAFAGRGLTKPLVNYTDNLAKKEGFKWQTLVSLGPAKGFWARNGYTLAKELEYEGHTCYYMEKPVPC